MEIRNQSKTGPVVPPLAANTTTLGRQIDDMKQSLLDRLNRDAAGFARIEIEIHDRFRHLADQMTARLLPVTPIAAAPARPAARAHDRGGWGGARAKGGPRGGDRSQRPPETRRLKLRLLGGWIVWIA